MAARQKRQNDKDISHSPFIAQVEKNILFRGTPRVRVVGLPKEIILHRPIEFQVRCDKMKTIFYHIKRRII